MTFKALQATKAGEAISTNLIDIDEGDLMPGNVNVNVDYSTVNYKDAMGINGRGNVIRQFPLIPGIDLAGTVEASTYPGIAVGDRVVANGWGLSQTHHGGYAQKARLSGDWLVKIQEPLSTLDAMAIGTAGYTAMLSVLALEHGGITPTEATFSSPAPMAASDRSPSPCCPTWATARSHRRVASRRLTICESLERPR